MPPQQQHRPGSSRLCRLQLINTVHFTAGANDTVAKSLVHAPVAIRRDSVQLRTVWLKSSGAQYRRFRNRLEYGSGTSPRAASRHWGVGSARTKPSARVLTARRCRSQRRARRNKAM